MDAARSRTGGEEEEGGGRRDSSRVEAFRENKSVAGDGSLSPDSVSGGRLWAGVSLNGQTGDCSGQWK